jgi:hypothetical protein
VLIFEEKKMFMLKPKVQEILNEKFSDHSNAYFLLFPEGYVSAFWDHNPEIRIIPKDWVSQA